MSKAKITARTGSNVPVSGQYKPSGGNTESTFVEGQRVPPNNIGSRQVWTLVDKTKHKHG